MHGSGSASEVPPFLADVGQVDGLPVVRFVGELDLAVVDAAMDAAQRALESAPGVTLVVDAGDLTFCDSTGIRMLLELCSIASRRGTTVAVRHVRPRVRKAFEAAGVLGLLGIDALSA
jgi:anti-sigma B factor antagonist